MGDQDEDFASLLGRFLVRMGFTQQELANKIGMHRNTIVKWMNRTSWPTSRGQVLRVADELSLLKEERKALIQAAGFSLERWPTEVWTVPQQRDMFFTGRDHVFQSLQEFLLPGSTIALTQAISGLGGVGKTHMAVEYAYRFHKDYEAVLWLQAESWEILISACVRLASELELPMQKETDQAVAEIQHWLRKHRNWLLILDNVENPQEILQKFVPTGHQGCVLVTTRVHDIEPLARTQVLSTMSEQEGVLFLLRRTKKIASATGLEQTTSTDYNEAQQIWKLLDGLPLALDQAGAYILETGCSFIAYQEQYTFRRAELLHRRGKRFIGHEASVATTFSLVFERVEDVNSAASNILRMCSLLYGEIIPEEIFQEGAELLRLLPAPNQNLDEALGVLQDYSIVQRSREEKTLSIHRLVQEVLRDEMEETEKQRCVERLVLAVNLVFPHAESVAWPQCERLLSQALVAAAYIREYQLTNAESGRLLDETASYLLSRARYKEAEALYQQALHIKQQQMGPEHLEVATLLHALANLYYEQGNYEEAEPLYQRALSILEPEHPSALLLHSLAALYYEQGNYEEAEPLYQRALSILGSEHPNAALPLNGLASLYAQQGKYAEAESLFRQALAIYEQRGPEHPDVAFPLNNLAHLYQELGEYESAEPLFQRALHIRKQQFGLEHPLVAFSFRLLAGLYVQQGKYAEAESLFRQALAIYEQRLGPEYLDVAALLCDLASLYSNQGKYEEAESLFQRALAVYKQRLGPEHSEVGNLLNSLAVLQQTQGRYEEAELLYQQALRIKQQLGPKHIDVASALNNLASLYHDQGNYEKAEPLYQQALAIWEQSLGMEHINVASALNNLAEIYYKQKKYMEAEPLYRHALHIFEQQLGAEHPLLAYPLNGLANLAREQGDYVQAEPLYQRALHIREQAWGSQHPEVAESTHDLAQLREKQNKRDEAKILYTRALASCALTLGTHHPRTVETRKCLIALLHVMGQHEEAVQLETVQTIHE